MASSIAPQLCKGEYLFLLDRGSTKLFLPEKTLLEQKDIITISGKHLKLDHSGSFTLLDAGRVPFTPTKQLHGILQFEGRSFHDHQPYATVGAWRVLVRNDRTMTLPSR